jgi:hypothetical protein
MTTRRHNQEHQYRYFPVRRVPSASGSWLIRSRSAFICAHLRFIPVVVLRDLRDLRFNLLATAMPRWAHPSFTPVLPARKINFYENPRIFSDLRAFGQKNRVNPLPRIAMPRRAFPQSAKPLYRYRKSVFARPPMRAIPPLRASVPLYLNASPARRHSLIRSLNPVPFPARRDHSSSPSPLSASVPVCLSDFPMDQGMHSTRASSAPARIFLKNSPAGAHLPAHLPRPGAHLRLAPAHLQSRPPLVRLPSSVFRLPSSVFRLPSSGSWLLASCFRLPASGFRLPAPGSRLPAPGSRLPASTSQLPTRPPAQAQYFTSPPNPLICWTCSKVSVL